MAEQEQAQPDLSPHWTANWQMPALIAGIFLFTFGVWLAISPPEKNDFDGKLDSIEQYLVAQNLEMAQKLLEEVAVHINQAPQSAQARFQVLAGDRVYLFQELQNVRNDETATAIHTRYSNADELEHAFSDERLRRWALTLVALDRPDEAFQVLDRIGKESAAARYAIVREMIERRMARADRDPSSVAPLLDKYFEQVSFETDPAKLRTARLWGTQVRAQMLLDANQPGRMIDYLNPAYARFSDQAGDDDLAPLMVKYAQAYFMTRRYSESGRWYQRAQRKLKQEDPLNAKILVGLARIAMIEANDIRQALEYFSGAQTRYPDTPSYLDALIGRADCEARLGADVQAIDVLTRAVAELLKSPERMPTMAPEITDVVRSHYEQHFSEKNTDVALQYLTVLVPLYGDRLPTNVLADFALTHEQIARTREEEAKKTSMTRFADKEEADRAVAAVKLGYKEAAIHYGKAADYFYRHAERVTITNNEAHGDSLWQAATLYEKAQMWTRAIEAFGDFVRGRPNDPRHLMANSHLGLAYMADGQFVAANDLFEKLIDRHPKSAAAHNSHVPYARCFIAMGEFDRAQQVLEHVVSNHPGITPEAKPYREALIELGKLYYQQEDYERGIEKLEEAIDERRFGETEEGPALRFRLADAYRQSVSGIATTLSDPLPQSRKVSLNQERSRRLERAQVLFSQVISAFEARPEEILTPLERTFYRNAYFYRADCAYDLGRFEQARSLYDLAAKRWEDHPASLVALVQIVNTYCEEGAIKEARVANDRARFQLKRIPDEAFDDPTLPMNRQHWEDWLRWTSELNLFSKNTDG